MLRVVAFSIFGRASGKVRHLASKRKMPKRRTSRTKNKNLRNLLRRGERIDSVSQQELAARALHAEKIEIYNEKILDPLAKIYKKWKVGRYRGWANQRVRAARSIVEEVPDRVQDSAMVLHDELLSRHSVIRARTPLWSSEFPEIAVIGHSNCGKSSTVNALCGAERADDERITPFVSVSARAGWTTGIQWVQLQSKSRGPFCLVDMPGYGDAVSTKQERQAWKSGVKRYFKTSQRVKCCIVLLDATRGVGSLDFSTFDMLQNREISVMVVLTKADLLRPRDLAASHEIIVSSLEHYDNIISTLSYNAEKQAGVKHVAISARHMQGIKLLWDDIIAQLTVRSTHMQLVTPDGLDVGNICYDNVNMLGDPSQINLEDKDTFGQSDLDVEQYPMEKISPCERIQNTSSMVGQNKRSPVNRNLDDAGYLN